MSRRRSRGDDPGLFDLPLDGPLIAEEPGEEPVEEPGAPDLERRPAAPDRPPEATPTERPARHRAPLSARFLAGLADLAVHLALAVALLFGARLLGVEAGFGDWPALALFLLVFSFFYSVLPLAFWGQTPGMAWAGLVARSAGGESLTFGQTGRRWLAALLTATLLGLPVLLALGGRSLADRWSGSETYLA